MKYAGCLLMLIAACDGRRPNPDTPRLELPKDVVTEVRDDFSAAIPKWNPVEGTWERREGVFAQTSTIHTWTVALHQDRKFSDVDVTVRFRPNSGAEDASGGIIFRARDGGNYFLVRANALEDNFRLYTMIDGSRLQIAGTSVKPPALGQWHSIRVVAVGKRIQAYLNGELLIDHEDGTFHDGWVGLWTKADSATEFDDLSARGVAVP